MGTLPSKLCLCRSKGLAAGMASCGTTLKAYQNGWHLDLPSGPLNLGLLTFPSPFNED